MSHCGSTKSIKSGMNMSNVGKMGDKPAMGMADMKQMMKEQLMNVKLYGSGGAMDSGRNSQKELKTLKSLEQNYDMPKFGGVIQAPTTPSLKTSRHSVNGLLKPPTSLRTPTAKFGKK